MYHKKRWWCLLVPAALLILLLPIVLTSCSDVKKTSGSFSTTSTSRITPSYNGFSVESSENDAFRTLGDITTNYIPSSGIDCFPMIKKNQQLTNRCAEAIRAKMGAIGIADVDYSLNIYPSGDANWTDTAKPYMIWNIDVYLNEDRYQTTNGKLNFTVKQIVTNPTNDIKKTVNVFKVDKLTKGVGFSDSKFLITNEKGKLLTAVANSTAIDGLRFEYSTQLKFGASDDTYRFNVSSSGIIISSMDGAFDNFDTSSINNGMIGLTLERENVYESNGNYNICFDVAVKNGTTWGYVPGLSDNNGAAIFEKYIFNANLYRDIEVDGVNNFLLSPEPYLPRAIGTTIAPDYRYWMSNHPDFQAPIFFDDLVLYGVLNNSHVDMPVIILRAFWNTYWNLAYGLKLSGVNVTKITLSVDRINAYRNGHLPNGLPMTGGDWNFNFDIKNLQITIYYDNEKVYLKDVINTTNKMRFFMTGISANSGSDVYTMLTHNYTPFTIADNPFTAQNLKLPLLYLGVTRNGVNSPNGVDQCFTFNRSGECATLINNSTRSNIILIAHRDDTFIRDENVCLYNYPNNPNLNAA